MTRDQGLLGHPPRNDRDTSGIQSVDVAMKILRVIVNAHEPLSLKEFSTRSQMSPSKLHRYLHSFVEAGLMTRVRGAGLYELGPFAVETGLAALQRMELVNQVADKLAELADETEHSNCLSVWSAKGPTIIRWQKGRKSINTAFGVGDVLPLLTSATGNIFLAYLPRDETAPFVEKERIDLPAERVTAINIDEIAAKIQEQHYTLSRGYFIAGVFGLAAPIFNWENGLEAAVTIVGRNPVDEAAEVELANRLVRFVKRLSLNNQATR